ncbi:hypothetical protein [Streptomyces albipurpureus]|uniref:Uncharacterized protein n=1 Tax=Streptomyces albipurpureus TaxID=2897419 RepID=A0ABT0UFY4_9ACTN|nr:hypothetical protein [Streptomyces sp. CWNU-1]MCM2387532.1 hypothetical protein [Streptomyces sp. CWNU-1]
MHITPPRPCSAFVGVGVVVAHDGVERNAVVDSGLVVGHGPEGVRVGLRLPLDAVRADHVPHREQRLLTLVVERSAFSSATNS